MINRRKLLSLLGISPVLLTGAHAAAPGGRDTETKTRNTGSAQKFMALSPKGTPPPVMRYSLAPPLSTIEGKTIYLVDTGFFGGDLLLQQVGEWYQRNMPGVKTVLRKKAGTYPTDDATLWAEIKANAAATIMAIGH